LPVHNHILFVANTSKTVYCRRAHSCLFSAINTCL